MYGAFGEQTSIIFSNEVFEDDDLIVAFGSYMIIKNKSTMIKILELRYFN